MCRRYGVKLCQTAKCPLDRRPYPPGMHGKVKGYSNKLSNYGRQLAEKQKARKTYGLHEKQFGNYFVKAFQKVGNTAELLFAMLENRLDNTVYRLGLAATRTQARQMVGHGHICVNGKRVDIASFAVKVGDEITIREASLKSPLFAELTQRLEQKQKELMVPWLHLDPKAATGKVTSTPKLGDVEVPVDWRMIVEFYSK